MRPNIDFEGLQMRLVAAIRIRVRSGELTERSLARLTGVSQPHIHNVLKGVRILSTGSADRILSRLRMSLWDLVDTMELDSAPAVKKTYPDMQVPTLGGRLGPGESAIWTDVNRLENLTLAPLMHDPQMSKLCRTGDWVLLDRSESKRRAPAWEYCYACEWKGEGMLRYVWQAPGWLYLIPEDSRDEPASWQCVDMKGLNILDIVKAQVVWLGRCEG